MEHVKIDRPEIKLMGISVRTNLMNEMNPLTAHIGKAVQKYYQQEIASRIPSRQTPGTTYCVYTNYESDYRGDYTYFIGEEVISFDDAVPEGMETHVIPPQHYIKFTTKPGPMPQVCIQAWQHVWMLETQKQLGGDRVYNADFEVYDDRAADPLNVVLDIYIGLK